MSPFPKSLGLHFVDACIKPGFSCERVSWDWVLGLQSTDLLATKPFPETVKGNYFVLCPGISRVGYRGQ